MVFFLPYLSGGVCRAVSLLFSIAHPGERCKQKKEQSHRNQLLQLYPEGQKPSPLGDRFPPTGGSLQSEN